MFPTGPLSLNSFPYWMGEINNNINSQTTRDDGRKIEYNLNEQDLYSPGYTITCRYKELSYD